MSDGYVGMFQRELYPEPVESVSFNEVADSLELTWPVVISGVSSEYEIWSSVGDLNHFNLIGVVSNIEIASGLQYITIVDQSYETATTIYYRIYHKAKGYYSLVLESGIQLAYSVPDPTDLSVAAGVNQISLNWINDTSRLLDGVSIIHMAAADQGDLVEVSGIEVFSGLTTAYTYEVPTYELDLWHQFWISSVTRTT